jgi:hypothetical protein
MAIAVDDHTAKALAELEAGIRELSGDPEFRRWLKAQSMFWRYSFNNALLIARARPDASAVAGFHTWRKLDRSVKKGSTAIRILAPCTRRTQVDDDHTGGPIAVTRITGFKTACVFAYEDTDGTPLPESPCHKLTGEAPERLYDRLAAHVAELGWTLSVEPGGLGGPNGLSNGHTREVKLDGRLSPRQAVKTLSHELGHVVAGHVEPGQPRLSRDQCETEAEAISFIVMSALGVDDAGQYSLGYIATWNSGTDEAITALRECCTRISDAARTLLMALAEAPGAPERRS